MSKAVLILGMHRSGTSAAAGALARLGVALGDRLMAGHEHDNPRGYHEHRAVVEAHDRLALGRGRSWDDPRPAGTALTDAPARAALAGLIGELIARDFPGTPLWAVKDPRLCRFLPGWLEALAAAGVEPYCLLVLRAPAEVARSLARRDGFSAEKSAALWLDHVLDALRATPARRRARLSFDELLDDPVTALTRCARELDLRWPREPAAVAGELQGFLQADLRHHRGSSWAAAPGPLARLADTVWLALEHAGGWPAAEQVDGWHDTLAELSGERSRLALEHATQVAERWSRARAWEVETALRGALDELEARLGNTISPVAEELAAHARELVTQGEALTVLERRMADEGQAGRERLAEQRDALVVLEGRVAEIEGRIGGLEGRVAEIQRRAARGFGERVRDAVGGLLRR